MYPFVNPTHLKKKENKRFIASFIASAALVQVFVSYLMMKTCRKTQFCQKCLIIVTLAVHSTCFMIMSSIITESNLNAVITYLNVGALDFNTVRQILEEQLR